ncbi:DUF4184 family protein [Fulvivirgaceae bacterium PWU5]|uniref:DUF4184 family protein n=1 Tax=Dawidia cretensis TaxID=2782350 RepID=A0AAP2GTI6_9BACT|nr:DUF4184 family protein [Dawidia cretensis]MBT1712259.1 DUF4184 family protein [Dawidia cretensis]
MPFTPSHAALVLPLLKNRKLSATGLIIGSMAPDFAYFFTLSTEGKYSHTLLSILYFNIPVTIFLGWMFHEVVKKNLLACLPAFFRDRFYDTYYFEFVPYLRANLVSFAISAALGTASHIFWDSFTHADGYFASRLPFYQSIVVPYEGVRYPLFYALQYISSFIGLLCILVYILLKERRPLPPPNMAAFLYWLTLLTIAVIVVVIRFTIFARVNDTEGVRVVVLISGLCLGGVISGLIDFRRKELV